MDGVFGMPTGLLDDVSGSRSLAEMASAVIGGGDEGQTGSAVYLLVGPYRTLQKLLQELH